MLAASHKSIDQGWTGECVSFAARDEFANSVVVVPECQGLPSLRGDGANVD